uniref:Uncharacterized protein n=1 Tax=Rhizophora mucronata TaxID=61149 RepID=A0A2P2P3H7_RHIMU
MELLYIMDFMHTWSVHTLNNDYYYAFLSSNCCSHVCLHVVFFLPEYH